MLLLLMVLSLKCSDSSEIRINRQMIIDEVTDAICIPPLKLLQPGEYQWFKAWKTRVHR